MVNKISKFVTKTETDPALALSDPVLHEREACIFLFSYPLPPPRPCPAGLQEESCTPSLDIFKDLKQPRRAELPTQPLQASDP